jgi:hypothetical protein
MSLRILVAIGETRGPHRRLLRRAAQLAGKRGRIELPQP